MRRSPKSGVEFLPATNAVVVRVTFDSETTHPEEQQRQGWQAILDNFAKHVMSKHKGAKLRTITCEDMLSTHIHFTRRPYTTGIFREAVRNSRVRAPC